MPRQSLGSLHSGIKQTLTGGDPMDRSMGHYGKSGGPMSQIMSNNATMGIGPSGPVNNTPTDPTAVRNGSGGIKNSGGAAKLGGLGSGNMGAYGSPRDYGSDGPADNT